MTTLPTLPTFITRPIARFGAALVARAQVLATYGRDRGCYEIQGSSIETDLRATVAEMRRIMDQAPSAAHREAARLAMAEKVAEAREAGAQVRANLSRVFGA